MLTGQLTAWGWNAGKGASNRRQTVIFLYTTTIQFGLFFYLCSPCTALSIIQHTASHRELCGSLCLTCICAVLRIPS